MNLEQFYQLSDDELVGTKVVLVLRKQVGIAGAIECCCTNSLMLVTNLVQIWLVVGVR